MKLVKRRFANIIQPKIRQSLKSLNEGDFKTAKEGLEWINIYNELSRISAEKNKIKWSSIIIILSLILISLSIYIRIPIANIISSIKVQSIAFRLNKNYSTDINIKSKYFIINNIDTLSALNNNLIDKLQDKSELEITGLDLIIKKIEIDSGSIVEIVQKDGGIGIYIRNGQITTSVGLRNCLLINDLDTTKINILKNEPTESVKFISKVSMVEPTFMYIDNIQNVNLRNISATNISFLQEDPAGSGNFISTILNGQIKILETNQTVQIENPEQLILDIDKLNRLGISISKNALSTTFESRIKSCKIGVDPFLKEIKPNILQFLYFNNEIALLWSSLLFLWGLMWSIKKNR